LGQHRLSSRPRLLPHRESKKLPSSAIPLGADGVATLWPNAMALLVFTLALVLLSVWRFRKQLA